MLEAGFLSATFLNLLINLLYTLIALFLGLCAFKYFDQKLFSDVDFAAEIKKGNIAVAIFVASILYFIAYVIAHALK